MRGISKSQQADIDKATDTCKDARDELEKAIDDYNDAMVPLREKIEAALDAYNETVADLRSLYVDIAGEARTYYSERSARWQRSEVGQEYEQWVDRLEDIEIEDAELELPEPSELPESIPDFDDDSWLPPAGPGE